MIIQEAIARLLERADLSAADMEAVMRQVMTGEATPAQIGGFLVALRAKGETVEEVAAAAAVMRSLAERVDIDLSADAVDIVGTGGDASGTFNISTASALVAAAAGVTVAKHGNRSVSSRSGAADLLEAAGVNLDLTPDQVGACIREVGVGFMFAPRHHGAMKHAIGPRREMGVRTVFNLLGPLTNPAGVTRQVLGVFDPAWVRPLAEVLQRLGAANVMVVHGLIETHGAHTGGGMDEISLSGATSVAHLHGGRIDEMRIAPEQFGMERAPIEAIRVDGPAASLAMVRAVLAGESGAPRDIVLLNAGAAIHVGGHATTHAEGVELAHEAIDSGGARDVLARLVETSVRLGRENAS